MKKFLMPALALAALATAANAAVVITMSPVATSRYALTFTGTGTPLETNANGLNLGDGTTGTTPGIYKIDFKLNVSGTDATHTGVGSLAYDINGLGTSSSAGLTRTGFTGSSLAKNNYVANNLAIDYDADGAPDGPAFVDNSDFGTAGDLKSIVNGIDANIFPGDARLTLGQSGFLPNFLAGSIYVKYDGTTTSTLTLTPDSYKLYNDQGGYYPQNTDGSFGGGSVTFFAVPEPASLSLLGLGVLGLAARRRQA